VIRISISWRSAAPPRRLCRDWGVDQSFGANILRHEVGVLAKTIAGAFDLDHDGVMKEAVKECGGNDGIAEDRAHSANPRLEVSVRGGASIWIEPRV
jgi:hypothetical protein